MHKTLVVLFVGALVLASCDSGGESPEPPVDLSGRWIGEQSLDLVQTFSGRACNETFENAELRTEGFWRVTLRLTDRASVVSGTVEYELQYATEIWKDGRQLDSCGSIDAGISETTFTRTDDTIRFSGIVFTEEAVFDISPTRLEGYLALTPYIRERIGQGQRLDLSLSRR